MYKSFRNTGKETIDLKVSIGDSQIIFNLRPQESFKVKVPTGMSVEFSSASAKSETPKFQLEEIKVA